MQEVVDLGWRNDRGRAEQRSQRGLPQRLLARDVSDVSIRLSAIPVAGKLLANLEHQVQGSHVSYPVTSLNLYLRILLV
jgi:hypothetical protein